MQTSTVMGSDDRGRRAATWRQRLTCALLACAFALTVACDRRIYVVDGVTDGDQFYILPGQLDDDSPVVQSWIAYSLVRSACQLNLGEDNPARSSAFDCEFSGREALVTTWRAYRQEPGARDDYLDTLLDVSDAGFLREYVWVYLARDTWAAPATLDLDSFNAWRRLVLEDHRVETRLIGAWI